MRIAFTAIIAATALLGATANAAVISFTDRTAFHAASSGLVSEDFESGGIAPGSGTAIPAPLDSTSSAGGFQPGDIAAGLSIGSLTGSNTLAYIGDNYVGIGGNIGRSVFANDSQGLTLSFAGGAYAVGFDALTLLSPSDGTIELFGTSGSLGLFNLNVLAGAGTFAGFVSTDAIHYLTYNTDNFDGVDNIEFGNAGGPAPTPEPASLALLGLGLAALTYRRRKA